MTSHAQPLPKVEVAAWAKRVLKPSKLPNAASSAWLSSALGFPVEAAGPMVAMSRVSQNGGALITVTTEGSDLLELVFSDECWTEIADGTGSAIYGDLNRAGDTLQVYGTAPFEVLVGKAPAVQMAFNGERINLRYSSSDQTAKIKVPR